MRKLWLGVTVVAVIALMAVLAGCSCSSDQQASSSTASASQAASSSSAAAEVSVPDVVNHDSDDARHMLVRAGLIVGDVKRDFSDTVPANVVISQDPAANSKAKRGDTVSITVSLGKKAPNMVAMPDLMGRTQEDAERVLKDVGLVPVPGNPVYSDSVAPGVVCQQYVRAGEQVAEGSHITFNVSLGRETVSVPNELGRNFDEAKAELSGMSLGVDRTESYSDNVAAGLVISQSVAPGTQVTKGTTVSLEVSLGAKPVAKVKVPDITTYTLEEAEQALESAGLAYSYSGDPDGTVNSVSPKPGTEVEVGSTVKFTLQHVSTLVAVPDVVGYTGPEAQAALKQVGLELDYDVRHPERLLNGTVPAVGTLLDVGTYVQAQYAEDPVPEEQVQVPDLKGMSAKKAAKELDKIGLKLKYDKKTQADAVIESTKPKAGTKVDPGTELEPVFKKADKASESSSSAGGSSGSAASGDSTSSAEQDDSESSAK